MSNNYSATQWERMKELFNEVVDCPPRARESLLNARCGENELLRNAVWSLIESFEKAGSFIDIPPGMNAFSGLMENGEILAPEQRIGPYQIVRELGSGGMGAVYLAKRVDEQFHKLVAIKIVKPTFWNTVVFQQFRKERHILAGLEHPNIARVLDGGTTSEGLPFLVMEYIEGTSIDTFCNQHKLSIRERLQLFLKICAAVQSAHQKLVVHRDLKPGNILVTAEGEPKLLDFGIAKLLDPNAWDVSLEQTQTGLRMMTPRYASPEQIRGEAVTTATDVYSLGIVLFELLTGLHPYLRTQSNRIEIEQAICDTDPHRPSTAINWLNTRERQDSTTDSITPQELVSQRSESSPKRLRQRLEGDLDTILLKALQKNPAQRYSSVEQFAEDIRRHLDGLPVLAQPDSTWYRTRKFIKRQRVLVVATGLIVLTLTGGISATLYQAYVAKLEKERAIRRFQEVRELANSFLFEFHDSIRDLPGSTPAREQVVKKALIYLDRLQSEAGSDPELQLELATAYQRIGDIQGHPITNNLGHSSEALTSYQKALAIREAITDQQQIRSAQFQLNLAENLARIGDMMVYTGHVTKGFEFYRRAIDLCESLMVIGASPQAQTKLPYLYCQYGLTLVYNGNQTAALDAYRKSVKLAEVLYREDPNNADIEFDLAQNLGSYGDQIYALGNAPQGLEILKESKHHLEHVTRLNPNNTSWLNGLALANIRIGNLLMNTGDPYQAIEYHQQAKKIRITLAEKDPTNVKAQIARIIPIFSLAGTFALISENQQAISEYTIALQMAELLTQNNPDYVLYQREVGQILNIIGGLEIKQNNLKEATTLLRRSKEVYERLYQQDPNHSQFKSELTLALRNLAIALNRQGQISEAKALTQRALEMQEELARPPDALPNLVFEYAVTLITGEPESLRDPVRGLEIALRAVEKTNRKAVDCLTLLARAYLLSGNHKAALSTIEESLRLIPGDKPTALRQELETLRRSIPKNQKQQGH